MLKMINISSMLVPHQADVGPLQNDKSKGKRKANNAYRKNNFPSLDTNYNQHKRE